MRIVRFALGETVAFGVVNGNGTTEPLTITPMRGHPVFVAQHATATCCRGCVAKWHHIPQGRELTDDELGYLVAVVMAWIEDQLRRHP